MKKILLIITTLSLSFAGTMYFQYDTGDDEFISVGYNHPVKEFDKWSLAVGTSYDKSFADEFDGAFMKIYMLDLYPINETFSLWGTFGYSFVMDEGVTETYCENGICAELEGGLTYGLGFHYKMNDQWGMGLGYSSLDYTVSFSGVDILEDEATRTDLHFSYSF